jgi:hypothetical protein
LAEDAIMEIVVLDFIINLGNSGSNVEDSSDGNSASHGDTEGVTLFMSDFVSL